MKPSPNLENNTHNLILNNKASTRSLNNPLPYYIQIETLPSTVHYPTRYRQLTYNIAILTYKNISKIH